MNNEKKIEIPAMPEKYRLMLGMLPEEPAGSKEEQLRAQQQMLEELAKQIVTGQDAGTTNEAGTL